MTGISAATIWRMERQGEFPARRQLTEGRVGWLDTEVEEWLRTRPVAVGTRAVMS
jgi:prophage regulatory protein